MGNTSKPSVLAAVTKRADIRLLSLLVGEISNLSTVLNFRVRLSSACSSLFGVSAISTSSLLIGCPYGELWDEVKQINWSSFDCTLSKDGIRILSLEYSVDTKYLRKKQTRSGNTSYYEEQTLSCVLELPITNVIYKGLSEVDRIFITAKSYDNKEHDSIEVADRIEICRQNKSLT